MKAVELRNNNPNLRVYSSKTRNAILSPYKLSQASHEFLTECTCK